MNTNWIQNREITRSQIEINSRKVGIHVVLSIVEHDNETTNRCNFTFRIWENDLCEMKNTPKCTCVRFNPLSLGCIKMQFRWLGLRTHNFPSSSSSSLSFCRQSHIFANNFLSFFPESCFSATDAPEVLRPLHLKLGSRHNRIKTFRTDTTVIVGW